jgi:hypothetical protein
MSASVQSQVMAKAVALLNAASMNAFRTRMSAFSRSQLPAQNVLPEDGETEYLEAASVDRRFRFKVRYVEAAVDEVDAAVDLQYVAGNQALLADTYLGGLVRCTHEIGQKWEFEKGEVDTVALVVTYEVEFATTRSDPSVQVL